MALNLKLYLGIGLAILASMAYRDINSRLDSVEEQVTVMRKDVVDIKKVILESRPVYIKYTKKDVECLARNIYYEAGTESIEGKIAVANITVNRAKTKYWGKNICDVVYSPEQFSWTKIRQRAWNNLEGTNWEDSQATAVAVLKGGLRIRQLKSALFYHADYVNPNWKDDHKKVIKIGKHIFYTQAKGSSLSL